MATHARRVTQRCHQVALAQTSARDEHDVGVLLDEVQVGQILDEQPVDLGGPIPVELIERLEHRESGLGDAALHAPVVARERLAAEQLTQILQVRPRLGSGGLRQGQTQTARDALHPSLFLALSQKRYVEMPLHGYSLEEENSTPQACQLARLFAHAHRDGGCAKVKLPSYRKIWKT